MSYDRESQLAPRPREFSDLATRANIEQARTFDARVARVAFLYDLGIWLSPAWHRRLNRAVPHVRGPRVLEVSFGTGYLMSRYAEGKQVTGLDYSRPMIARARKNLAKRGLRANLVCGDAQYLPFADESFDCVVNTDAFSLYPDAPRAMSEFHRVLAKGGRLVLMESYYPKDRNRLGMMMMAVARMLRMPLRDMDGLLSAVGFSYTDTPIGMGGVNHLYLAEKV